jgi:hypothetical protein
MRLRRVKTQWLMVTVIIAGILTWGVPALVDETARRWKNCRDRAAFHAGSAAHSTCLVGSVFGRPGNSASWEASRTRFSVEVVDPGVIHDTETDHSIYERTSS